MVCRFSKISISIFYNIFIHSENTFLITINITWPILLLNPASCSYNVQHTMMGIVLMSCYQNLPNLCDILWCDFHFETKDVNMHFVVMYTLVCRLSQPAYIVWHVDDRATFFFKDKRRNTTSLCMTSRVHIFLGKS